MSPRRFLMLVAVVAASVAFSSAANAQTFPGGGIDPGDSVPAGGTNSVVVTGVPNFASVTVSVTWTATHTWVGDVILRLTAPDATVTSLVTRAGSSTPTGVGDSSNLQGTYTFDDSATNRIIDIASTGDTSFLITPGSYRATNNLFNSNGTPTFSGEALQQLNNMNGNVGDGTWTLFYSDNAGGDYAAVTGWAITFAVPEPTTWALMGTALIGAGGYGYRRMQIARRGIKTRFDRKK